MLTRFCIPITKDAGRLFFVQCRAAEARRHLAPLVPATALARHLARRGRWKAQAASEHFASDNRRYGYCFVLDESATWARPEVLHHPFHQLYNGYSPWWLTEPVYFSELAELVASTSCLLEPMGAR